MTSSDDNSTLWVFPGSTLFLASSLAMAKELSAATVGTDSERLALERRFEDLAAQLASLRKTGSKRVSGDPARLLQATVQYQNDHMFPGLERDDAMRQLGLKQQQHFDAAKELYDRGFLTDWLVRTTARLDVFVQVVAQVVPGVEPRRELAQILALLARSPDGRASGETLETLGLPIPRALHLLEYLKEIEFIDLRDQWRGENHLPLWYAALESKGKAYLRGDEDLPGLDQGA